MTRPAQLFAIALGAAALSACAGDRQPERFEGWQAVVEWPGGASDIVERSTSLGDCMAALARFDGSKPYVSTYCEPGK